MIFKSNISKFICLTTVFVLWSASLWAGELDKQRVRAGLELFPSMLAADVHITEKKTEENRLFLLLVYRDRREEVEDMADFLKQIGTVRKISLSVDLVTYGQIADYKGKAIAGIFLTQKSPDHLKAVITFGEMHHALVFSPFPGDVERGVQGGILITDVIKPYINTASLLRADITLKPFFLQVAERYEP